MYRKICTVVRGKQILIEGAFSNYWIFLLVGILRRVNSQLLKSKDFTLNTSRTDYRGGGAGVQKSQNPTSKFFRFNISPERSREARI